MLDSSDCLYTHTASCLAACIMYCFYVSHLNIQLTAISEHRYCHLIYERDLGLKSKSQNI